MVMCVLYGMVLMVGVELLIVLACVYLIDWDQVIKDATVEIEEEWRRDSHTP